MGRLGFTHGIAGVWPVTKNATGEISSSRRGSRFGVEERTLVPRGWGGAGVGNKTVYRSGTPQGQGLDADVTWGGERRKKGRVNATAAAGDRQVPSLSAILKRNAGKKKSQVPRNCSGPRRATFGDQDSACKQGSMKKESGEENGNANGQAAIKKGSCIPYRRFWGSGKSVS